MPDYEDLILKRQEEFELWEDDPDSWMIYYGGKDEPYNCISKASDQNAGPES